ncbi:MAG: universal stress protein [Chloroflexota bacterium]
MTDSLPSIKRILVPLDMNRLSEGKIPNSEAQAKAFGAELLLLHIIPTSPPTTTRVTFTESQALTYLNTVASHLRTEGIETHSLVRYGDVADVIVNEIERQRADLVILGTSTRTGLPRLFLGSVTEDVIARAPCPVLLVRPNVADAEKPHPVRSFDDDVARAGPVAPRDLGPRLVSVNRIVGSVGRAGELDEHFRVQHPSRNEQRRYERVRELMETGAGLPPITLYKLGYGYYVLDGNHRVAAARELGQLEMEAEVTEFLPLGDPQMQRAFAERRAFERRTGLIRIGATQPGHYPQLEAMIREYAQEQGIEDMREAAYAWQNKVYRPVARRIRALRLGHYFPDLRTADVFVEIANFREHEGEDNGHPPDWEEAISRFREKFTAMV